MRTPIAAMVGLVIVGAADAPARPAPSFRASTRILVKPRPAVSPAELAPLHAHSGGTVVRTLGSLGGLQVVSLRTGMGGLDAYRASPLVEYAEPDYVVRSADEPNDPLYRRDDQWALHNVGKAGGAPGADIHAPEGWAILSAAPRVIVAIIDGGVEYRHVDLKPNIWTNPGEVPGNGIDDDHDGYVDDVHGIDAIMHSGDPLDPIGHGTAVAGVIGAAGNNRTGMTGVAWRIQMLPCRFLPSDEGHISEALECIDFVLSKGARIVNCSWGGSDYSQALHDAIATARNRGVVFVAAAGNHASDTDVQPFYPASYDLDNIVAVAATRRDDTLAAFSNYGVGSVDLAAPGAVIVSTFPGAVPYKRLSGTSLATPHVTGALALLMARFPLEGYASLIARLFAAVDPLPTLAGKCVTGGRLNLARALGGRLAAEGVSVLEGDSQGTNAAVLNDSETPDVAVPVTLLWPVTDIVTVDWATTDGSARDGEDYVGTSGTLTFHPGETTATIYVSVVGDTVYEANETLVIHLSDPVNAGLADPQVTVAILNDDPQPTISFESRFPIAVRRPLSGTTRVGVPVVLSAPAGISLDYAFRTCGGTATPNVDYDAVKRGTVRFPPGVMRTEIGLTILPAPGHEPAESFFVNLGGPPAIGLAICLHQERIDILDGAIRPGFDSR